ncbi:MAG TPA: type 1 glutamine amidotransferase [Candidatus Krumholzibacteria bacterium]|nr:type 1 glutamine amidotransferase [Candidatus Krumholzibacteria bacterium]
MRVHCLQHVAYESPGRIRAWTESHGHEFSMTRLHAGDPLPSLAAMDALVVMGGPMGVHDDSQHAWMRGEKHLIAGAIEGGKRVLGVCLGAQMIAHAMGARVYRNRFQEIGWFPVEATDACTSRFGWPRHFDAFHWHGDTFALPEGAEQLARTGACEQQMFAIEDRIVGIQFHLEVTPDDIENMLAHSEDLPEGPYVRTVDAIERSSRDCAQSHRRLDDVLSRWLGDGSDETD